MNNVDESGFPLNNSTPQIISEKRIREVVSLTNVERGENRSMLLSSRNVHSPDGNIQPSEEMSRI